METINTQIKPKLFLQS